MICPICNSDNLIKKGWKTSKQRYQCKSCGGLTVNPLENSGTIADGYTVKGQSILYDADGKVKLKWEKVDKSAKLQLELIKSLIKDFKDNVKPIKRIKAPKQSPDDLCVIIPIGDAHIGMLAWAEQSGADHDLVESERIHKDAIDMLIKASPDAQTCYIIDLGDFLHADNIDGLTSRSGHNLDADFYHKVVRVAFRIARYYIEQCAVKYPNVIYRPEIGNHNDVGAVWLQESLANLYELNPRIKIANNASNRFYFKHGLCFFGSHHGHEIKKDRLPEVMASHILDQHIETKYRKWFTGHIHHQVKLDYSHCEVQSYRTLAPKDNYSHSHGYNAPRDISSETWHKRHGEIATNRVNISMIEINENDAA